MKILLTLFLILPNIAFADFVASAGLIGGSLESKEEAENGRPYLKVPTYIGFKGEAEFGHPYVTLFGAFDFGRGQAKAEYDFEDSSNPLDQARVSKLDATMWLSRITAGLKLKLIKLRTFRLYAGGGLEYGIMSLVYDEEDFESSVNSTIGFEESEQQNFRGGFGHVGMEFIIDANSGFRIQVQKDYFRTDEFETLNNEKLKFEPTTYSVSFMQYIDM